MNIRKLTGIVVMSTVVILSLYDVYAFTEGGTEGTISHVLMTWSYAHPAFTFAFGFLCGHLFWRIRKNPAIQESEPITKS
jgi:hypothetical protein